MLATAQQVQSRTTTRLQTVRRQQTLPPRRGARPRDTGKVPVAGAVDRRACRHLERPRPGCLSRTIVRLLILTGQRREEIGGLRQGEICDGNIVLPDIRTKNRRAHIPPLSAAAQSTLARRPARDGDFVFGGDKPFKSWSRGKTLVDARLAAAGVKLDPWRLHDIRGSVATGMAEAGIAPHIIEAVLNHVSGHKAGIAGVYNRASYDKEKRAALSVWSDHVMAAVEGRDTTSCRCGPGAPPRRAPQAQKNAPAGVTEPSPLLKSCVTCVQAIAWCRPRPARDSHLRACARASGLLL
jgi:integrase